MVAPMPKLLYEKQGRIAYVTLNRPEAKNAIDPDAHRLLWETWEDFRDDDSLDVAILTGAGDAFCAGADLKEYIPPIMEWGPRDVRENVNRSSLPRRNATSGCLQRRRPATTVIARSSTSLQRHAPNSR
jgi:enoyl-CoA hydratase/carnithine racemase